MEGEPGDDAPRGLPRAECRPIYGGGAALGARREPREKIAAWVRDRLRATRIGETIAPGAALIDVLQLSVRPRHSCVDLIPDPDFVGNQAVGFRDQQDRLAQLRRRVALELDPDAFRCP